MAILAGGFYILYKRRNKKAEQNTITEHINHTILKKDEKLKVIILTISVDTATLNAEFKELENVVKDNVKDTTHESTKEDNSAHNRYRDIGNFLIECLQTKTHHFQFPMMESLLSSKPQQVGHH